MVVRDEYASRVVRPSQQTLVVPCRRADLVRSDHIKALHSAMRRTLPVEYYDRAGIAESCPGLLSLKSSLQPLVDHCGKQIARLPSDTLP